MELIPNTKSLQYHTILVGCILIVSQLVVISGDTTTNGEGGEVCGPDGRKCHSGKAYCDKKKNKCVCKEGFDSGRGDINCYKKNTFHTEVYNDPTVKTYNGLQIPLSVPCRYLWTHTDTLLKGKKRKPEGRCIFQASAFHQKDGGKFYVAGFDVAIKLTYNNGTVRNMSLRKWGKASNGYYQHWFAATDHQFLPNGPWGEDKIHYFDRETKLRVQCKYNEQNNLAVLKVKKCGITIQFRPYDCVLRKKQPMIPHLSYAVNCAYKPSFLSQDKVVAIPPASDHGGMIIDDVLVDGLDREGTILYRALTSGIHQNGPWANEQCAVAKPTLERCNSTQLPTAVSRCLEFLKIPRFIKCFDKTISGVGIMRLFNRCVDIFCNGFSCNDVIKMITKSKCHLIKKPYPVVTEFVAGSHCP